MNTRLSPLAAVALGFALLAGPLVPQIRPPTSDPCEDAVKDTQLGSNCSAIREMDKAEPKLASLLKRLGPASDRPDQKAWEAYRDVQLETPSFSLDILLLSGTLSPEYRLTSPPAVAD